MIGSVSPDYGTVDSAVASEDDSSTNTSCSYSTSALGDATSARTD